MAVRVHWLTAFLFWVPAVGAQVTFTQYPVPNAPSGYGAAPQRITTGSDGNLWFTQYNPNYGANRIGRITPAGVLTQFPAKQGFGITAGSDGNLWFLTADQTTGRFNPTTLQFQEFPSYQHSYTGMDMVSGPDGKLYYTQYKYLTRMKTDGTHDGQWPVPGFADASQPQRIAVGPDGNLWVTEGTFGGIAKVTTSGVVTEYRVGNPGDITRPFGITAGPDGHLYFAHSGDPGYVGRITTSGVVAPVVSSQLPYCAPSLTNYCSLRAEIALGPDGNLWVGGKIGCCSRLESPSAMFRISPAGALAVFPVPGPIDPNSSFLGITAGPDGNLWVTDSGANKIVKVGLPGPRVTQVSSTSADGVYATGAVIAITVEFDKVVSITGAPQIALNSGGVAIYSSGSGTNTLTFTYTVSAADASPRLDAAFAASVRFLNFGSSVMAISLGGGTIRDASGNDAILLLPVSPAAGSLGVNKMIAVNPPDSTPPVSNAVPTPLPNANGWNRTDVAVTITATDLAGSGVKQIQYTLSGAQNAGPQVVPGSSASVAVNAEGTTTISYFTTDNVGNAEAAKTLTIRIDKTGPVVAFGAASPAPNAASWNRTDVSIAFIANDLLSGVDSAPASPLVLTAEGISVSASVVVTDRAGNAATFPSSAFKIDKTAPVINGVRAPLPNASGWNNTAVSVTFPCMDGLSGLAPGSPPGGTIVSTDGANQAVSGSCHDVAGNSVSATVGGINIDQTPPVIGSLAVSPNPAAMNTAVTLTANLADAGHSGIASAQYTVNGGAANAFGSPPGNSSSVTATAGPFPATGIYTICASAQDVAGNGSAAECLLLPVYDPDGGFVTGGGSINSPPGAYAANPLLSGKANFGFVSRYQKGATVPSGGTQFHFQTANLQFKSAAYEWLVVAGARAQFKGSGDLNGSGGYQFLLTAIDGQAGGGGGVDRFRIKIWNADGIVYDNQMGASDAGNEATALEGGNIVIRQ